LGFATDTQQHGGQPWWYYLPVIGGGGLPWILYLRRSGGTPPADRDGLILLWCWLLGGLLLLSVAGSKLVTYALPAFPPIAILAALCWDRSLALPDSAAALRVRARVHALIFAVVAAALPWAAVSIGGGSAGWPGWFVFGAASLGWLWVWQRIPDRPLSWSWLRVTVGTGATYGLALVMLGPAVAEAHSARALAGHLNGLQQMPPRVFLVAERVGSIVFYLRPDLRRPLDRSRFQTANAGDVGALAGPGDVIAVLTKDVWRLGDTLASWSGHQTTVGRHVVYGPRQPDPGQE
jgi:4-amino-4-deoxy-L-arabinose transferase-like glycosyltransferase